MTPAPHPQSQRPQADHRRPRTRPARPAERGSVTVEFAVVVVAVLAGFVPLAVFGGRMVDTDLQVRSAAHAAARAASLRDHPDDATRDADAVARANLTAAGQPCPHHLDVTVDTTNFAPGGTVTVTIVCDADFSDVATLGVAGSRRFTATAVEVIDTYRSRRP